MKRLIPFALAMTIAPVLPAQSGPSVTLFNSGRTLVRQNLAVRLPAGTSTQPLAIGLFDPSSFSVLEPGVSVERLSFDAPKTRRLAELLGKVGAEEAKVLVLTNGHNPNVYLSGRNLPTVQVMNYADASAYDILWSEKVVVEEAALTGVEPEVTDEPAAEPTPRKAKAASRPAAEDLID